MASGSYLGVFIVTFLGQPQHFIAVAILNILLIQPCDFFQNTRFLILNRLVVTVDRCKSGYQFCAVVILRGNKSQKLVIAPKGVSVN